MKYYRLTCGCRRKREELWKDSKSKSMRCPIHRDNKIDCIIITCADCGKKMIVGNKAGKRNRCDPCQYKRSHKRKLVANKKPVKTQVKYFEIEYEQLEKPTTHSQILVERSDCKHRYECLNVEAHKERSKGLNCPMCDRYEPMEF